MISISTYISLALLLIVTMATYSLHSSLDSVRKEIKELKKQLKETQK